MTVDARIVARALAAGRVALGAALVVDPARTGFPWVGRDASRAGTRVFGRALGARDVALGLATLAALREDRARPLVAASAVVDLVDGWATWTDRDRLPARARLLAVAVAGGAGGTGAALARRL